MIEINWQWKQFQDLSVGELYELLKLRQEVFVIEQRCVYADIDDVDKSAWHLLGVINDGLCAYSRVIASSQKHVSIGRVLTSRDLRGQGVGKQVMQKSLDFIADKFPGKRIKISAQAHLEGFYSSLGFVKTSEPYDEDGIMHIDMLIED